MHQKDTQRLKSLYSERLLQIKREGVIVEVYSQHQILPAYAQCALGDLDKLRFIVNSNVHLELCNLDGVPQVKIDKRCYFVKKDDEYDHQRVYFSDKGLFRFHKIKDGTRFILVKNNATIGVLSKILERRLDGQRQGYFEKIENFIGDENCTEIEMDQDSKLDYEWQSDLNFEQNEAIQKCFSNHMTFIKGPPGCGKTKTVARMVRMLAQRGLKILVGSVSNIANQSLINQIIRQLQQHNYLHYLYPQQKPKPLKMLVNYSRKALQKLPPHSQHYSFNNQLYYYILSQNQSQHYHQQNIMHYIETLQKGETVPSSFWAIYKKSSERLIRDCNVVVCTTVNSFKLYEYTEFRPGVGVVDEAAQASWADSYGFLAFGVRRMVFVGDEKQLAPTVIGDSTANNILKETMFQKLCQKNQKYFVHLVRQYRMHPKISQFPNLYIYQNRLINDAITQTQRQSSIQFFSLHTVTFVNHQFYQQVYETPETIDSQKGAKEYSNPYEASLISELLQTIPEEELKNVGIVTFYGWQAEFLEANLGQYMAHGLVVKTIDGYQGAEKDYIIVSTVRCNNQHNPGFCIQPTRVNVALTRAKKGLIVFGNAQTLLQGKQFNAFDHNIWGHYYLFMYQKNQILDSDQFMEVIQGQKDKKLVLEKVRTFCHELNQTLKIIADFKHDQNEDDVTEKNLSIKKQAKSIISQLRRSQHMNQTQQINGKSKGQNSNNFDKSGKILQFFNKQEQNSEYQSLQVIICDFFQTKFTSNESKLMTNFLDKFLHKLNELFVGKISSKEELKEHIQIVRGIFAEQKQDLAKDCQKCLNQVEEMEKEKKFITKVESSCLSGLVSAKLQYELISRVQTEIEKVLNISQHNQITEVQHKI